MKSSLTQARLKELIHYDPKTGLFTWRQNHAPKARLGQRAGHKEKIGPIRIRVEGHCYMSHRLAWLYMKGKWPEEWIDHKDGDPSNNRWKNLRQATPKQNQWNKKRLITNTSGRTGVSWIKKRNKWRAFIGRYPNGKFLGLFDEFDEAVAARLAAEKKYHGQFRKRHEEVNVSTN